MPRKRQPSSVVASFKNAVNNCMVYDSKTFQNLHNLTKEGLENYRNMLEKEADRILFRHEHPFAYWWQRFKEIFS